MIVQNIDHLLMEPELTAPLTTRSCRCLSPSFDKDLDYNTVSSGFFVCQPSLDRYQQMLDLAAKPSPDPEDQLQFNGTWHWGDQEMLRVVFHQLSDGK